VTSFEPVEGVTIEAIAESAPHAAVWLAWPYLEWGRYLAAAQTELAAFADALSTRGGERVRMLVATDALRAEATAALGDASVELVDHPYGDIWMRDIAPTFVRLGTGELGAVCFAWNGWGGKYLYEHDSGVAAALAALVGVQVISLSPMVSEGGALELDGAGSCLTTRDCLLNPNRNPMMDEATASEELRRVLGVSNVHWLDGTLANDHTDGHIDTLARFVSEGTVACMEPEADDPNRDTLREIRKCLSAMRDASGRRLEVVTIPSPGRVEDDDGTVMPANYTNFYIANDAVFVPTYDVPADERAVEAIGRLYPGREAIGIAAKNILTGGGALHCITREQPTRATKDEG